MIISPKISKRSFRALKSTIIICSSFFFSTISSAQSQTAIVGQATQLKFNISNVVNSKKCHIEVTFPDQTKTSVEVDGPQFLAVVDFIPQKIGNVVIQWEGKNKIRGVNSVFACPGSGVVQLQVNGNAEQLAQKWNQYFSQINDEVKDCVKYGMDLSQFKYQVVADPNTVLTSPDDPKLKPIYEKCESFAKQKHPSKAYSCILPLESNAKSTCDAVYAEKQSDGKLKTITRADAIQLHFDGKPWVIGQIENPDARISRLKQNEENKLKQAAEQAAKSKQDEENKLKQAAEQTARLEAEEKDRKFKESPEYKKQQAELERKRIAEEKQAEKIAAEAERKRITEEKQAEKIAAELERKRIAEEKEANARQDKERKENEIKDKKWQEEQDARSKKYIRELAEREKNEASSVQQASATNEHSKCISADKNKFYVLDLGELYRNKITTTEVSILARGKKVCFMSVDKTVVEFDNSLVSCDQISDTDRLAASKLGRTGYKVIGQFRGVIGKTVMLKDCLFEKL